MNTRIVITGLGVVSALGTNRKDFVDRLFDGRSGVGRHADVFPSEEIWAGLVADSDMHVQVGVNGHDRTAHLAICAVDEALTDAGLSMQELAPERIALLFGTSHGGRSQLDRFVESGGGINLVNARRILETGTHQQQAAVLAAQFGIHGPVLALSTACSSSGIAIALGIELLRSNIADAVLAGGADAFSKLTYAGFRALGATADGPCGPFSGTVGISLGEGAGFMVLETLDHALERGARIHGELFGYATSWDAHHLTAPDPTGDGMRRAMLGALATVGATPQTIDYVNAHGTGTRSNDISETLAIKRVFAELGRVPAVSATKSFTGHTLGASSAIGCLTALQGMEQAKIPPTANFNGPRIGCDLDYVPNHARPAQVESFFACSAAFGGVNCALYGGRFQSKQIHMPVPEDDDVIAVTGLSALTATGSGVADLLSALRTGRSGIDTIHRFDVSELDMPTAGMVANFNSRRLLPTVNLRRVDGVTQYATVAVALALADAGIDIRYKHGEGIGLVVATTRGATASFEGYLDSVKGGRWSQASPVFFPNLVMSSIGGNITTALGLRGLASTCVGGVDVGLSALVNAVEFLRRRADCTAVVVVAADEITPLYYRMFHRLGRLADDGAVRPYDPDARGVVLGEGAVAMVLERASSASARPYGTVLGYALNSDAQPDLAPEANGTWLERAARAALSRARLGVEDLGAVFGLARGAPCHDSREAAVLERLLEGRDIPVGNLNGHTGLVESACGLLAGTASFLAMARGEMYPILGAPVETRLPLVRGAPRMGDYPHAMVFGSSDHGNNAAVIFGRGSREVCAP